jgi:hypothetical protein
MLSIILADYEWKCGKRGKVVNGKLIFYEQGGENLNKSWVGATMYKIDLKRGPHFGPHR